MKRRATPLVATLALALACSREPPPIGAAPASPEPAETETRPAPGPQASPWWFSEGPGLAALEARRRGDHAATRAALETLLATELTSGDRAAASLLMALEEQEDGDEAAAIPYLRAALADELEPLHGRIRPLLARALLVEGQVEAAREVLGDGELPDASASLQAGDASIRSEDRDSALRHYRNALALARDGLANEARVKVAELLATSDQAADRREALALFDAVLLAAPVGKWGDRARDAEQGLADVRGKETKAETRARARARQLAMLWAHKNRREYRKAEHEAKRWIERDKGLPAALRCEIEYLQGTAVFKQRDRPRARPVLEAASKTCAKAGNADLEVKSRYQAARGRYAEGQYARAARAFESLAADHADHTYADDALIKGGEAWETAGESGRARAAWQRSIDVHSDGDMVGEARRRILVAAFREDAPADVEARLSGWMGAAPADERARIAYFHGRALAKLGRTAEAEASWLEALRLRPISYAGMQSMSRLREQGNEAFRRGLDVLARGEPWTPSLEASGDGAAARAAMCASLALERWAQDELEAGDVAGWPAVALLGRAGAWGAAQRKLANLGSGWRDVAPGIDGESADTRRRAWELAHPRPFSDVIAPGEREHAVPSLLTYAIMQTESRFEPWVTSWAGARGLVQLMPGTAADLARRAGVTVTQADLYDPAVNLDLGMLYLGRLANRFGGGDVGTALAIPSYNAGPGSVDKWLKKRGDWDADLFVEAIPYDETRRYTRNVLGRWFAYRWLYGDGPAESRVPYLPLRLPSAG
jgi:soluble lytic murein transglycosylase